MKCARVAMSALACITTFALQCSPLFAANLPTLPTDSIVSSPIVSPDRKVTFHYHAPGAATVKITGDFAPNGLPMTKDDQGNWNFTTDTLKPGIYGYFFLPDGVRTVDPANLFISSGAGHLKSYVEIPGDKDHPEFWEVQDVPHGNIHENLYKSPTLGNRRVIVYTPPGYDAAAPKTYPVIYLYHGATDNETYWMHVGRANYIMDNLIAGKKATPAICVACFGHKGIPPGPETGPNGELYDSVAIEDDLLHQIIPLVEKEYHASKESKDRAILGMAAMGGYHALTIGLNNPKIFGSIAGFSSGFRANQNLDNNFKGLLADLDASKKAFTRVRIQVGSDETGNVAPSQTVDKYLTTKGIPHELIITPGGIHAWVSWRAYFRDFMSESFKN